MSEDVAKTVRESYEKAACCGSSKYCCAPQEKYSAEELKGVPEELLDLSSSCGNPVSLAQLREGQVVVDIGCGAGLDLYLASRKVGPTGRVIGVDSSPSMLAKARMTLRRAGVKGAEFLRGTADSLPLRDATADVVLSNCVLCTIPDKARVLKEIHRVLKPSGRAVLSDVISKDGTPPKAEDAEVWTACLVGVTPEQYLELLRQAGFARVEVLERSPAVFRDGAVVESMIVVAHKSCGCQGICG